MTVIDIWVTYMLIEHISLLVHEPHYFTPINTTTVPAISYSLPDITTDMSCHPSSLNYCRLCSNISTRYWHQQTHINLTPNVTTCATCSGFVAPVSALYKHTTYILLTYRWIILRINLNRCFFMLLGGSEECQANISQYIWREVQQNKSELSE